MLGAPKDSTEQLPPTHPSCQGLQCGSCPELSGLERLEMGPFLPWWGRGCSALHTELVALLWQLGTLSRCQQG